MASRDQARRTAEEGLHRTRQSDRLDTWSSAGRARGVQMLDAVCTSVYRFHPNRYFGRGTWTILDLGFPACPVRFALLQVETLGPWGGPGQRTQLWPPSLSCARRQGNMWTLAGVSRAEPWDPRIRISITRAAK